MIIAFSCENCLSFRDQANFSMLASLERQHGGRLALSVTGQRLYDLIRRLLISIG